MANNNSGSGSGGGEDDWCTIESDPGVFTELLETLGCKTVELQELWSLDDDTLSSMQEQSTVYGLIFLFQWIGEQQQEHAAQKEPLNEDDIPEHLFFAHQVTTNACATQAILSVVLNAAGNNNSGSNPWEGGGGAADTAAGNNDGGGLELGELLTEFRSFTASFPPALKGVAISSSDAIKTAHNSFSRADAFLQDPASRQAKRHWRPDEAEAYHFVAYVPVQGIVYELDGLQKGPMVVGAYDVNSNNSTTGGSDGGWLAQARAAIQERMAAAEHVKYNLMAVVQDKRLRLQQRLAALSAASTTGDASAQSSSGDEAAALLAALAAEQAKREQWKIENQRRRHNYVPLCVQLFKELARNGSLPQLVQQAKERRKQEQQQQDQQAKKRKT